MNKLYTIQVNVPICPECGGGLKFNQIGNRYRCIHCGAVYRIVNQGQNEREFICEGTGMVEPRINQKVKTITGEVGNIHKIYPPCNEHSGRIIVYIPSKHRPVFREFWFNDLGETLFLMGKEQE